jgi:hypothetical protein
MMLRRLLDDCSLEHTSGTKKGKTTIVEQVYMGMRQAGYRFLAPFEDIDKTDSKAVDKEAARYRRYQVERWIEVDESTARKRIAHRFRNIRYIDSGSSP